jgi:hypothetical protein
MLENLLGLKAGSSKITVEGIAYYSKDFQNEIKQSLAKQEQDKKQIENKKTQDQKKKMSDSL